jgi:hypothetical protein
MSDIDDKIPKVIILKEKGIEIGATLLAKIQNDHIGSEIVIVDSLEEFAKQKQQIKDEADVSRLIKSFDVAPNLEQRMLGAEFYNTKMRNSKPRKGNNKKYVKRKKAKNGR